MNLTITQSNTHYVVTSNGLILRILSKKALVWNLKHAFGLTSTEMKALSDELKQTGTATLKVA